jgi:hypothetical protein
MACEFCAEWDFERKPDSVHAFGSWATHLPKEMGGSVFSQLPRLLGACSARWCAG